jgi:hypothetical protein
VPGFLHFNVGRFAPEGSPPGSFAPVEPLLTVFSIDTNNSPESYELSATIIE